MEVKGSFSVSSKFENNFYTQGVTYNSDDVKTTVMTLTGTAAVVSNNTLGMGAQTAFFNGRTTAVQQLGNTSVKETFEALTANMSTKYVAVLENINKTSYSSPAFFAPYVQTPGIVSESENPNTELLSRPASVVATVTQNQEAGPYNELASKFSYKVLDNNEMRIENWGFRIDLPTGIDKMTVHHYKKDGTTEQIEVSSEGQNHAILYTNDIGEVSFNVTFKSLAFGNFTLPVTDGITTNGSDVQFVLKPEYTNVEAFMAENGTSIGAARMMANGSSAYVSGVVTTPDYGTSNGQFYIQDQTGGLNIFYGDNNGLVSAGDRVIIKGTIGAYNSNIQIQPEMLVKISEGNTLPAPVELNGTGLTTSSPQLGKRVVIKNVSITNASQWPTNGSDANVSALADGVSFVIRIEGGNNFFDNSSAPTGLFTLTGILGVNNTDVQVLPFFSNDIVANPVQPVLTLDKSSLTFAETLANQVTEAQEVKLTGGNLLTDVTVTVKAPFQISTDNTTFGTELTLAKGSISELNPVSVWVRFAPTSDVTQNHKDAVIFASAGVSAQVEVTGDEKGTVVAPQYGDVLITEVMYDSKSGTDEEWVELYNNTNKAIDISGWMISDDDTYPATNEGDFLIPNGTTIPANGYLVLSWVDLTGITGEIICDRTTGNRTVAPALGNGGDNLVLYTDKENGTLIDGSLSQNFNDGSPNNAGYSIERSLTNGAFDSWDNATWSASSSDYNSTEHVRCTPGAKNSNQ